MMSKIIAIALDFLDLCLKHGDFYAYTHTQKKNENRDVAKKKHT